MIRRHVLEPLTLGLAVVLAYGLGEWLTGGSL